MLLNAENLFLLFDQKPTPESLPSQEAQWKRLSTSTYDNKTLKKTKALAQIIQEINPDLILLCEVGGLESLDNFNELFLQSQYSTALLEGNSDRNIDVGYLVKKNLPFYFDLISNKNRPINFLYSHERLSEQTLPSHKFSRDFAKLKLFKKNSSDPFLIILLAHLKSRLDYEGIDPGGFQRRRAELATCIEIYKEIAIKYPKSAIVVAGDFNGNASRHQTDEEFRKLYLDTDLEDVLEIEQIPLQSRVTYYQIRHSGKVDGRQIDYCFLSSRVKPFLKAKSAFVYRYKYDSGFEIDTPQSVDAKLNLPSDHYPVVFELVGLPFW